MKRRSEKVFQLFFLSLSIDQVFTQVCIVFSKTLALGFVLLVCLNNHNISLPGDYICEVETFGDPIDQTNQLHVLGKSKYCFECKIRIYRVWLSATLLPISCRSVQPVPAQVEEPVSPVRLTGLVMVPRTIHIS